MKKFRAFTLAEVLITLGIIGVVAAMTMPSLVANYQKKVWVNQLKKSVSVLEQGFQKMLADDGVDNLIDTSVWGSISGSSNDIDCMQDSYGNDPSCTNFYNNWKNYFKIVDINKTPNYINYFLNSRSDYDDLSTDNYLKFADGMWVDVYILAPQSNSDVIGNLTIDVNGSKLPNMYGRDIFSFDLQNNGKLKTIGDADMCTQVPDSAFMNCAKRIVENGWEMDY